MTGSLFGSLTTPTGGATERSLLTLGLVVVGSGVLYGVTVVTSDLLVYVAAAALVAVTSLSLFAAVQSRIGETVPAGSLAPGRRLLVRAGIVEVVVAVLVPLPMWGHALELVALALLTGVFCSAVLKCFAGAVTRDTRTVRTTAGMSFVLDGLLMVGLFGVYVAEGLFEGTTLQYALVTLAGLVFVGLGVEVYRGAIDVTRTAEQGE